MGMFFLIGVLFFISPFLSGVVSFILLSYNKDKFTKVFLFYLALLLGVINSLKVPESDLINYELFYKAVEKSSFITYIFLNDKEFLFYIFNYIMYYLTFGNFDYYIIIFTIITYYLLFLSLLKMHKTLKLPYNSFLISIAVAFLFPNLFSLSSHLMRQFMAASIAIYFLVLYVFEEKRNLTILITSILTHTTSFIFAVILTPFFKKKISLFKITYISLIILVFLIIFFKYSELLFSVFEGIPVLSYLFSRVTNLENAWQTDNLSLISFLLLIFNTLVFYKASHLDKTERKIQSLFYFSLLLLIFVTVNYNNTEIALRFSFYTYFLFPFAFYFLPNIFSYQISTIFNKILIVPIVLLFVFLFFWKLNYGTWMYQNLESLTFLYGL